MYGTYQGEKHKRREQFVQVTFCRSSSACQLPPPAGGEMALSPRKEKNPDQAAGCLDSINLHATRPSIVYR